MLTLCDSLGRRVRLGGDYNGTLYSELSSSTITLLFKCQARRLAGISRSNKLTTKLRTPYPCASKFYPHDNP